MTKYIKDLTSRDAVVAAIAEFDQLGRDAFLAKYGYKRARQYRLVHEAREYDSKAIAGVAFGEQFGIPLTPYEFIGGARHCVPVLEKLGFEIRVDKKSSRNPDWSRDELMLALHLYLHNRHTQPGKRSAKVKALSELLGTMSNLSHREINYRNAAGVYMKLMNFRSIDPLFTLAGKKGLKQGSKDDQVVWNLYAGNLSYLDTLVSKIKDVLAYDVTETGIADDDEDEIEDCEEGRILTRMHRFRERNRKLVAEFKKKYLAKHGHFECAGCDFDFSDKYGEVSARLIDVHHTKPVHTLKPGDKTKAKDLALLCVSCHRAVHARKHWLGIAELRQHLSKLPKPAL